MLKHVVVGFFFLLLIASTQAQVVKAGDLVIEHAHARATKGNMPNSASFLQIANKGKADDALLSMYLNVSIDLTIVPKKLPQYQKETKDNPTTGFFGYLPNLVNPEAERGAGFITSKRIVDKKEYKPAT